MSSAKQRTWSPVLTRLHKDCTHWLEMHSRATTLLLPVGPKGNADWYGDKFNTDQNCRNVSIRNSGFSVLNTQSEKSAFYPVQFYKQHNLFSLFTGAPDYCLRRDEICELILRVWFHWATWVQLKSSCHEPSRRKLRALSRLQRKSFILEWLVAPTNSCACI